MINRSLLQASKTLDILFIYNFPVQYGAHARTFICMCVFCVCIVLCVYKRLIKL